MIRRNKYHARKVEVDGIRFDSKKEAMRYQELKLLQAAGAITDLQCHPRFDLIAQGVKIGRYTADFSYYEKSTHNKTGEATCDIYIWPSPVVEDVKGVKTEAYRLRARLFQALYPNIQFREL